MPMHSAPFASEVVLPLLAEALRDFRRSTGWENDVIAEELALVATALGTRGFTIDKSRVSRLINWKPKQKPLRVDAAQWAVFFHVLPEFREQIREATLRWLGQSAPDFDGDLDQDKTLQKSLRKRYRSVEFIIPSVSSQWCVFQVAAMHLATRIAQLPGPQPAILLSGGPTQNRLCDALPRFKVTGSHQRSRELHFYALNNHHHADNPEVSADAVAVRWAKQFGGQPHWTLTRRSRDFEEPDLVILGVGGPRNGHIARLAATHAFGPLVGDVGYLPIDDDGRGVAIPDITQHLTYDLLSQWSEMEGERVVVVVPHNDKTNDRAAICRFLFRNRLANVACLSNELAGAI